MTRSCANTETWRADDKPHGTRVKATPSASVCAPLAAPLDCADCGDTAAADPESCARQWQLLKRVFEEREAQEQSLAFEIHEGLAQQMIGSLLHLQAAEQLADADAAAARADLQIGMAMLKATIDKTLQLAARLRPSVLDEFGLAAGVKYLVFQLAGDTGLAIEFSASEDIDRAPPEIESGAFRIIERLLARACRRDPPGKVRLELGQHDGHIRITVQEHGLDDDGDTPAIDIDPAATVEICHRARLLGGRMTVSARVGGTSLVAVELPIFDGAAKGPLNAGQDGRPSPD